MAGGKPERGGGARWIGGGCGFLIGLCLVVAIGGPAMFVAAQPCVEVATGQRATCDNTGSVLIFIATLLAVPLLSWLGVKVGRGGQGD